MAGVKVATIWRRDNPSTLLSAGEALQLQWRQPGIIPLANSLACAVYHQGMSITKECLLPRNVYYQGMSITKEYIQDSHRPIAAARLIGNWLGSKLG
jgi:hypothetical protein